MKWVKWSRSAILSKKYAFHECVCLCTMFQIVEHYQEDRLRFFDSIDQNLRKKSMWLSFSLRDVCLPRNVVLHFIQH